MHERFAISLLSLHYVKSVQIRSLFWSVFSRIRTEYGEIRSISPYSVRMWENTDQRKLRIYYIFSFLESLISNLVSFVHSQIEKFTVFFREDVLKKMVIFVHVVKQCIQFQDILLYTTSEIGLLFEKLERQNILKSRLLKCFQVQ